MITLTDAMKKKGWSLALNELTMDVPEWGMFGGKFKIRVLDNLYGLFFGHVSAGYKQVKMFKNLDDALIEGERGINHECLNDGLLTITEQCVIT